MSCIPALPRMPVTVTALDRALKIENSAMHVWCAPSQRAGEGCILFPFSPPNPAAQKTEERAWGIAVAYFHTFAYFQRGKEAVSERVIG